MNTVNFFEEDMYHMFDTRAISDDMMYSKHTISYPDYLLNHIHDDNFRVGSSIERWSDLGNFVSKVISLDAIKSNIKNLYTYRKSLYIYNSLHMSHEKSFELYRSGKRISKDMYRYDLENIKLVVFLDNDSINEYVKKLNSDFVSITNLSKNVYLNYNDAVFNFEEGSTIVSPLGNIEFNSGVEGHIYLSILPIFNKNNKTDCLM